jgi:hypothetical protein
LPVDPFFCFRGESDESGSGNYAEEFAARRHLSSVTLLNCKQK